jgi:hypothetical protein
VSYLDDVNETDFNKTTISFFDKASVQLNSAKCKLFDLSPMMQEGIPLLGSCIGSNAARAAFLLEKVVEVEADLMSLGTVPHQHALLILRKSIQHKLRHLMRHLPTGNTTTLLWTRLDEAMWTAVDRIRSHIPEEEHLHKRDRILLSLPTALGGCGIFSHRDTASYAYQAAHALSSTILSPLIAGIQPDDDTRSQCELCTEASLIKQDTLLASLDIRKRLIVTENASQVGRRWLDVIPGSSRLRLLNTDIQAGLHYCTLTLAYEGNCHQCGLPNLAAHDKSCLRRQDYRVS